jgi:uncharacterized protein YggE
MKLSILLLSTLCGLSVSLATAQSNNNTIKVTGMASVNVSPNEIIIEVRYEEYFLGEETGGNRVPIDVIEKDVLQALGNAEIKDEKITLGGINVVRPSFYKNGNTVFLKRRLSKSLFICVETTDQLLKVVREMENLKLMDEVISEFRIVETRHTDIEKFKKEVKVDAFKNAREKAELILSSSGQSVGKVLSVSELRKDLSYLPALTPSSYDAVNLPAAQPSGFKPIVADYRIEVVFEIE